MQLLQLFTYLVRKNSQLLKLKTGMNSFFLSCFLMLFHLSSNFKLDLYLILKRVNSVFLACNATLLTIITTVPIIITTVTVVIKYFEFP